MLDSSAIHLTTHDGQCKELPVASGLTLAQAIFLAGLWEGVPLCAGMGKCGLCRVRFTSPAPDPATEEISRLGGEAVAEGWRLSCLHPARPCAIELPAPKRSAKARSTTTSASTAQDHTSGPLQLAVDLGTTSIHWAALRGGKTSTTGQGLNPQMGLGSEVMARLSLHNSPAVRTFWPIWCWNVCADWYAKLKRNTAGPSTSCASRATAP